VAATAAPRAVRAQPALTAYVLHQYEWSESSLILDLYTREQGRMAVVAKGARRPYSQLRAVLLPFHRIQAVLVRSAKKASAADTGEAAPDIQTLRSAEWAGGPAMLTGAALFSGFHLNELLMKLLLRNEPHAALFDAYADTLPCLSAPDENVAQAGLRAFELKLLEALGVLPDLSLVTLTVQPVRSDQRYTLEPEAGVLACSAAGQGLSGGALLGLQAALMHGSLPALQQACSANLPELKAALRGVLHYHLGTPMMRTRQLMLDVQSLER
jgi:DNA repair protein RecO (recombination protein O)